MNKKNKSLPNSLANNSQIVMCDKKTNDMIDKIFSTLSFLRKNKILTDKHKIFLQLIPQIQSIPTDNSTVSIINESDPIVKDFLKNVKIKALKSKMNIRNIEYSFRDIVCHIVEPVLEKTVSSDSLKSVEPQVVSKKQVEPQVVSNKQVEQVLTASSDSLKSVEPVLNKLVGSRSYYKNRTYLINPIVSSEIKVATSCLINIIEYCDEADLPISTDLYKEVYTEDLYYFENYVIKHRNDESGGSIIIEYQMSNNDDIVTIGKFFNNHYNLYNLE
jgi:hypothetical protein